MFERTQNGQRNRAQFYGVDFTCFVEGGGGREGAGAPDVTFWRTLFSYFRPDLKIKCVPRGGKPILQRLAQQILQEDTGRTLVAMDADYDEILDRKTKDRRVLYSFGYSWENDIYAVKNIVEIYKAISHCSDLPKDVETAFDDGLMALFNDLRFVINADIAALQVNSSIFPRKAPGQIVRPVGRAGMPRIVRSELLKICREVNKCTRPRLLPRTPKIEDRLRYCVGHILALAMSYLFKVALRAGRCKKTLSKDHLYDVGIQTLPTTLRMYRDVPLYSFHSEQFAVI